MADKSPRKGAPESGGGARGQESYQRRMWKNFQEKTKKPWLSPKLGSERRSGSSGGGGGGGGGVEASKKESGLWMFKRKKKQQLDRVFSSSQPNLSSTSGSPSSSDSSGPGGGGGGGGAGSSALGQPLLQQQLGAAAGPTTGSKPELTVHHGSPKLPVPQLIMTQQKSSSLGSACFEKLVVDPAVMMMKNTNTSDSLSSLARDICPIPGYAPNPLVNNLLLSLNSSLHLSDHYRDVQNSLSPSELGDFTRRLRTTFGREGKVTMGGVGVVALSMALLFDTLAKEVKGQWVPESGPIPGLFLQQPSCKNPFVPVVSEYLRLVPHVANNPARMREETEKYLQKLEEMSQTFQNQFQNDKLEHRSGVCLFNLMLVNKLFMGLQVHHMRLSNATVFSVTELFPQLLMNIDKGDTKTMHMSPFNCDLEAANKVFKQEIVRRNDTLEELKNCGTSIEDDFIPDIELVFGVLFMDIPTSIFEKHKARVRHRENFDLKAKSHLPF